MDKSNTDQTKAPSLLKLGACLIYEMLTLIALSFTFSAVFMWLVGDSTHGYKRLLLQIFLWVAIGGYYVLCWLRSGQTLAMQAWGIGLVDQAGVTLGLKAAISRYVLATLGLVMFGLGFLWRVFDKDQLFLHDKIVKSVIVTKPSNRK